MSSIVIDPARNVDSPLLAEHCLATIGSTRPEAVNLPSA